MRLGSWNIKHSISVGCGRASDSLGRGSMWWSTMVGWGTPSDDDFSVFYEKPTSNFFKITIKNWNITKSLSEVTFL